MFGDRLGYMPCARSCQAWPGERKRRRGEERSGSGGEDGSAFTRSPSLPSSPLPPSPFRRFGGVVLFECLDMHGDLLAGGALGGEMREGLPFNNGLPVKPQLFINVGELAMTIRAIIRRPDDRHQEFAFRFLEISFLRQLPRVDNQLFDAAPLALRRASHLSLHLPQRVFLGLVMDTRQYRDSARVIRVQ